MCVKKRSAFCIAFSKCDTKSSDQFLDPQMCNKPTPAAIDILQDLPMLPFKHFGMIDFEDELLNIGDILL